jgi:hypothetical protein
MNQKRVKAMRGVISALSESSKDKDGNYRLTKRSEYTRDHKGVTRLADTCERHYYQKMKKEFRRI